MKISISVKGKSTIYWGAMPLPPGAEALGTVTRNETDVGALIRMATGIYVQGNAGMIRSLPQRDVKAGLAAGALSSMRKGIKEKPSEKQALASRENGKKGGRPKRIKEG